MSFKLMSIKSSGFSERILKLHQFYVSGVRILIKISAALRAFELYKTTQIWYNIMITGKLRYAHPIFLTPGKFQLTITRF